MFRVTVYQQNERQGKREKAKEIFVMRKKNFH